MKMDRITDSTEDLIESVRGVFAQVTRYPLEILDAHSDLEEDLGIDSVKLGEILSVLREKYSLPEPAQMKDLPRESFRTIAGISELLGQFVYGTGSAQAGDPEALTAISPALPSASSRARRELPYSDSVDSLPFPPDPTRKPFKGKIALVTGSGRGIGKDIAVWLARLGATVVVNSFHSRDLGIKTAEEISSAGGNAVHIWGSVANSHHRDAMFDEIEARYGGLDFFISNASNGMLAKLEDITEPHWEKAFRTNIVGFHQSALRAVRLMRKRGGGKIIALSSPAANGHVEFFGCMGAVKAAVDSLTKSMAIEFSPYNIQVNSVSPGPVYGELLNKYPESERLIPMWEQATAGGRLCEARDVSRFIAYLLDDSVRFFVGSVLVMDGGLSARGF